MKILFVAILTMGSLLAHAEDCKQQARDAAREVENISQGKKGVNDVLTLDARESIQDVVSDMEIYEVDTFCTSAGQDNTYEVVIWSNQLGKKCKIKSVTLKN